MSEERREPVEPEVERVSEGRATGPRERARQRMVALGGLAVVAAAPLVNSACDPMPRPYCPTVDSTAAHSYVVATGQFVDLGGAAAIELRLSPSEGAFVIETSFAVEGGTLRQQRSNGGDQVLTIVPDAGRPELRVRGTAHCRQASGGPFAAIVRLGGPMAPGTPVEVNVE